MAKLLTETIDYVQVIEEMKGEVKQHFLSGTFMQAGIPNRNHRIYPTEVLANESARFLKENISKNRAYGELNHPSGPNINLDRVAIHIKELKQDGNNFQGKALIASTPMGNIVKGLVADGSSLGVSSRALGSLKPVQEDLSEVQADLRLLAIDVVADPSAPDAYVNAIHEGAEWVFNASSGLWEQTVAQHKQAVQKYSAKAINEAKLIMFNQFLRSIAR
jgi:hypothetical protein